MSDRPGWDPNAQAVSGMQVARATGGVPRQVPAPVNDYATGIAGAFGAVLALGAARRSGSAKRVLGSLSRTASFLETPHLSWSPDPDAPGASVFLEAPVAFHPCADGFIVAEEPDKAVAGSAGVLGADELRALTCEAAVEALRGGGRRAAVARTPDELHGSAWVEAAGLLRTWAHPRYGPVSNVFGHAAVNGFSLSHGWPTHDPGEDNAAVLARVGYAEKEIDELVAHGAVLERVPLFPSASD